MFSMLRIAILSLTIVTTAGSLNAFAEHIRVLSTSESGVQYELIIESETPDPMKPLPVRINLSAPDGTPVTGAKIDCSLTMPAMAMPHNTPPTKETETPGEYKGIFLITMGGLWVAELSAIYDSEQKDSVVIHLPYVKTKGSENDVNAKLEELFQGKKQSEKMNH